MMLRTLLLFLVCVTAAGSGLCAEEEAFIYDSKGKRDPFIPLITDKVRFGVGMTGIETIDDITLEGIVWDPAGDSFAIINGVIMREHEQVNNVRITKIASNAISILIDEKEFTIDLVEEEEEGD